MNRALPNWIEKPLGLEGERGQGVVWSLDSSWGWAPSVTLLLIAFALGWVIYFYSRESHTVSRRAKTLLIFLRMGLVGLLLFMLAEFMITFQRTGLPYVVVIVDDSASMSVVDRYSDSKLRGQLEGRLKKADLDELSRLNLAKLLMTENDARLLRGIEKNYKLRLYFLAGAARPQSGELDELVEKVRGLQATGDATRLGDGVRDVLNDLRGTPPAAVILLTDGITTDGETLSEAARYARRKGVPLLTVGLGNEEPIRDVELADLLVDEVVFVDDVVNFQCTVTATGYEGRRARITLKEKGSREVLAETTITLGPDGQRKRVSLPYRPTKTGKFEYVVEVEQFKDEAQHENNRRQKVVNVRKEQIRVLLAQAYPNFEFRYLKHMLERDSTVDLKTVLQEADIEYAQLDQSALRVFPVRREELYQYDVVIFGDVSPAFLSTSVMSNLRDFVQQKGGGLIFIAGPRYTPMAFRDTPLAALFPIELGSLAAPALEQVHRDGFQAVPTDMGLNSPHMLLGDNPAETIRIWRNLPPLYWALDAAELKPAARVLAVHSEQTGPQGRRLPLFTMQYVGAGKVLFHGTDETWRWRYQLGDVLFARYWVQSIRYLARSKLLGTDGGAELTADRLQYTRGEPVRLRVRFVDERSAPATDDGVTVVLEQEGRKSQRVQLSRHATDRGIFEGVFSGARDGSYHAWMATPTLDGRPPSADFLVTAPPGEFERVEMDVAELAQAAELSRGKFYQISDAGRLLSELPEGRQVPVETLPPLVLWNRWWVLSLFLGLIVSEWLIRKRKGLL